MIDYRRLISPLPLLSVLILPMTMNNAQAAARCEWVGSSGHFNFQVALGGPHWIPRDAKVGEIIGPPEQVRLVQNPYLVRCFNDGTGRITADFTPTVGIHPDPLPPVGGWDVNGKVLQTSIPGVGLHIRLRHPFAGANNGFRPVDDVAVPYQGYNDWEIRPLNLDINHLNATYTLIKTGPIPAGLQSFSQLMAKGTISDVGSVIDVSVSGTIQQAQCTLKSDAVSADPVLLGSHDMKVFDRVGATTPPVDFHIMLNDCEDDPSGGTARAFIRLDGDIRDPDLGLVELNPGSTASGIAIQLLKGDGSPMKLASDEAMGDLGNNQLRMDFRARYYQVSAAVGAGKADGKLNFTISYR